MAKLTLVAVGPAAKANTNLAAHRASETEGEALRRLLEGEGFAVKKVGSANVQQYVSKCPFHEGPGSLERKSPSFYFDTKTSVYYCHSASCGERGNLRTMERFFGIDAEDGYVDYVSSKDSQLKTFESLLTPELRRPFYEHGLTDGTIERFRLGYEPAHTTETGVQIPGRYVIPYLEGRRPKFFRYYAPDGEAKYKYTWESGSEATLFNAQDAMGDAEGRVFLAEGEQKAMLLVQMGYAAVAVPGASQWKQEWQAAFTHARQVFVCFDNDNPAFHIYDKPEQGQLCPMCRGQGLPECRGHNPGQEAAAKRVDQIGWRAKNVVLPLPDASLKKTDINDFFMRDGKSNPDFAELVTGKRATPFLVQSLAEIALKPPEQGKFLVDQGILPQGGRLLVAGRPKAGKLAGVSTPVLTPSGWTTMGALRPGDRVIGADGQSVEVTHIHPQGVKQLYRVEMNDGSSTNCGIEHLWNIQSHYERERSKTHGVPRWRTVDTAHIRDLLAQGKKRHTYIPMVAPVQFDPRPAPELDAYALGLLLGDGGFTTTSITFSKPDRELHEALAKALPDLSQTVIDAERGSIRLTTPRGQANPLLTELRRLGLGRHRSWEKFVPEPYLRASIEDRLAMLQGLLDTDGWVERNDSGGTSAHYCTTSRSLVDGVTDLVESLGGQVRVQHRPEPQHQGGIGREAWVLKVILPSQFEPFRLTRKLEDWRSGRPSKSTGPARRIVSVEPLREEEAVCITVANPDGLYVTEHYLVTHNSLFINNLCLSLAAGIPFLGHFPCDHPTRTMLLDRELSKSGLYTRLQMLMDKRPGYRAAMENLLIDHDHLVRLDQKGAYDTLSALVEQNGVEVLVMDTAYKFMGGDIESSSALSKAFEVLDKLIHQTGVSIVMTHHKRKGGAAKGKENTDAANPDDVAGSFLWTGWPNATILLNFLSRSVENPFNTVATFTAFRDAAPPDPLALYRGRDSVAYTAIEPYDEGAMGGSDGGPSAETSRVLSTETLAALLLEMAPCTEDRFLHVAASRFGCSMPTLKPYFVDALATGFFEKTNDRPPMIKFVTPEGDLESWESSMGLPEPAATQAFDLDPTTGLTVEDLG